MCWYHIKRNVKDIVSQSKFWIRITLIAGLACLYGFYCVKQSEVKYQQPVNIGRERMLYPSSLADSQVSRLARLRNWCKEHNNTTFYNKGRASHGCIVNHDRKIVYCAIPKVGCSTWRSMMILSTKKAEQDFKGWNTSQIIRKITEDPHKVHEEKYQRSFGLESFNGSNQLNDYFKFIFVREPFHRLLSAYRDKLQYPGNPVFVNIFQKELLKIYQNDTIKKKFNEKGKNVTFSESLQVITNMLEKGKSPNEHWAPITNLINPCLMEFDFIGGMETMDQDALIVMKHMFKNSTLHIDVLEENVATKSVGKGLQDYYRTVNKDFIEKIRKYYADDFEMFGYDPELI